VPRLEVDVRFLADDSLLVFHDEDLEAETTAAGPVAALDALRAASVRLRADERTALAFLHEVVDLLSGSDTLLQVDLKGLVTLSPSRLERLAAALQPVREQVLIGSQAHWNLWPLHERGFRVAFDPTLQWHYFPGREGDALSPARVGLHGLWDDSPLAHVAGLRAADYFEARVVELLRLVPASEWMVDRHTLLHLQASGLNLGTRLAAAGVELAAWTLRDEGEDATRTILDRLFSLGAGTIITSAPLALAGYLAGAGRRSG
jgi:glycerophosphoryl diester phosphodiesterase